MEGNAIEHCEKVVIQWSNSFGWYLQVLNKQNRPYIIEPSLLTVSRLYSIYKWKFACAFFIWRSSTVVKPSVTKIYLWSVLLLWKHSFLCTLYAVEHCSAWSDTLFVSFYKYCTCVPAYLRAYVTMQQSFHNTHLAELKVICTTRKYDKKKKLCECSFSQNKISPTCCSWASWAPSDCPPSVWWPRPCGHPSAGARLETWTNQTPTLACSSQARLAWAWLRCPSPSLLQCRCPDRRKKRRDEWGKVKWKQSHRCKAHEFHFTLTQRNTTWRNLEGDCINRRFRKRCDGLRSSSFARTIDV